MRSPITTHVLDVARGRPADGIAVVLARRESTGSWTEMGRGATDADGRVNNLLAPDVPPPPGIYRLTFDVGSYFAAQEQTSFYTEVPIVFRVEISGEHYHVPLLLSPYAYSTYRGS